MRGCNTFAEARVFCRGHAFLRNPRGAFYDLVGTVTSSPTPAIVRVWVPLTGILLGR